MSVFSIVELTAPPHMVICPDGWKNVYKMSAPVDVLDKYVYYESRGKKGT
jgi:hypothetical protein